MKQSIKRELTRTGLNNLPKYKSRVPYHAVGHKYFLHTRQLSTIFIPEEELQHVTEYSPGVSMHKKYIGRTEGKVFRHEPTGKYYLIKRPLDGLNLSVRAEYVHTRLAQMCTKPYSHIIVPEPRIVVIPSVSPSKHDEENGFVSELFASGIEPLERFCKEENKFDYSRWMQDELQASNYAAAMPLFFHSVLIAGCDLFGPCFSNFGKKKNTGQLVSMDHGSGSNRDRMPDTPEFRRENVIKMVDEMRLIENGRVKRGWPELEMERSVSTYGYYIPTLYPPHCTLHIFQQHFTVADCLQGLHLKKQHIREILEDAASAVEEGNKEALKKYNQFLQLRRKDMFEIYSERLEGINHLIEIVKFFYPKGQLYHNQTLQLLPSAERLEKQYNELLAQYGEEGLEKNVTPEMKRNITHTLLVETGLAEANKAYQWHEKELKGHSYGVRSAGGMSI